MEKRLTSQISIDLRFHIDARINGPKLNQILKNFLKNLKSILKNFFCEFYERTRNPLNFSKKKQKCEKLFAPKFRLLPALHSSKQKNLIKSLLPPLDTAKGWWFPIPLAATANFYPVSELKWKKWAENESWDGIKRIFFFFNFRNLWANEKGLKRFEKVLKHQKTWIGKLHA